MSTLDYILFVTCCLLHVVFTCFYMLSVKFVYHMLFVTCCLFYMLFITCCLFLHVVYHMMFNRLITGAVGKWSLYAVVWMERCVGT